MRFDVFTLFPGMFTSPFAESMVKRAMDAGLVELHLHNIRDYAVDKHHITDDVAYGGGGGMVMKPEPIFAAVEAALGLEGGAGGREWGSGGVGESQKDAALSPSPPLPIPPSPTPFLPPTPIILMSPAGRTFTHAIAQELAQHARLAFICGHYEGVDERVRQYLCTDEISIGNYVLTGGELPAMVILDAVSRLIPGMLPPGTPENESHASGLLEYPHYTRPAEYRGWRVPEVLLSGHHAHIARWRREQAELRTQQRQGD